MFKQHLALTVLLIVALLAPGMTLAEPATPQHVPAYAATAGNQLAHLAGSAFTSTDTPQGPPPEWTYGPFNGTMQGVGDLNGDGYDDALLVDPQESPWTRAIARVFYGSPTGLGSAPNWVLADHWQTCAAGDVNGDGYDDLFAGSLQGLQVFYGSHAGPTPGTPWRGPSVSLSSAGDVNGDGFDDLLVGDPFYTNGQEYEGRMVLYYGSAIGPSTTPAWTLQGDASARGLGSDVLSVGDINGDGYPEAIITEGGTYCYGNTGSGYSLVSKQANGSWKLITSGTGILTVLTIKGVGGWPDIEIGGPGFCFPVQRWNGHEYVLQRHQYVGKPCRPK